MQNVFATVLTVTGVLAGVGGALALLVSNPAVVLTPLVGEILAIIGALAIVCGTIHSALLAWQASVNANAVKLQDAVIAHQKEMVTLHPECLRLAVANEVKTPKP